MILFLGGNRALSCLELYVVLHRQMLAEVPQVRHSALVLRVAGAAGQDQTDLEKKQAWSKKIKRFGNTFYEWEKNQPQTSITTNSLTFQKGTSVTVQAKCPCRRAFNIRYIYSYSYNSNILQVTLPVNGYTYSTLCFQKSRCYCN